MTQRTEQIADITERVLQTDIALLNDHNVSDDFMSLLAGEHAARFETLCKAINPSLGRALLLTAAGAMLAIAKQIDGATVQEPELVHV
jgi:hypothetical protein